MLAEHPIRAAPPPERRNSLTVSVRSAEGKAKRRTCARSTLAIWRPSALRADPWISGRALFAAVALLSSAGLVARAETTSRIFALAPENREATVVGPLSAYLEGQSGNGAIWLKLPSGEVVKGRFEVKVGGSVGALGKAYGIDAPGGAYTGAGEPIVGGSPAVIDMKSPSGATVHCELMNDDATAHGSGVCGFSNGAVYRVLY